MSETAPRTLCLHLASEAATARLAAALAPGLGAGDAVLLAGPVGAGKSAFARALIAALARRAGMTPPEVPSPSFTLVQSYRLGALEVWHVDLYRLGEGSELTELGLEEGFEAALCLVEWPERLGALTPADALRLDLVPAAAPEARTATLTARAPRHHGLLDSLEATGA